MQAGLDLGQPVAGPADQHLAAVNQEGGQRLAQAHHARRAARVQDVEIDAEAGLQVRELEQALHQHVRLGVAGLGFEDEAHVLGALVAHIAQERRLLELDQIG